MTELNQMPRDLANKGCRRCGGMITAGDEFARGVFGYEYLCLQCSEDLGLVDEA